MKIKIKNKIMATLLVAGLVGFNSIIYAEPITIQGMTLTKFAEEENEDLKNIVILATGGTIAGTGTTGKTQGYSAGELDVASLVNGVPGLADIANISGIQVCNTASDNVTYANWKQLVDTINELAQDENIDGFVVTHGTDTLEETAMFLNLTVKTTKPVVITGAMRPSTATSADGPFNLYQSVALARSEEAVGRGVMVVFSDGIYAARDVQKINSFKTDAFNAKEFGCLGYMRDDKPYFFYNTDKPHTVNSEFDISEIDELPKVSIVYFHIDADPAILDYVAEHSDGIVIAAAGNGGMSSSFSKKVKEIREQGIPVVSSTRIDSGLVSGATGSNTHNPQKARVLLQLALTKTNDMSEITRIFSTY